MNLEYVVALCVAVALMLLGSTFVRRPRSIRPPFPPPVGGQREPAPQEAEREQTFKTMDAEARRAWWRW